MAGKALSCEELHTTLLPPVQDTDVDRLTCCPAGGIAPCPAQGGLLQQEESLCLLSTPPPLIDMPQPLLPSAVSPPAECLRSAEERRGEGSLKGGTAYTKTGSAAVNWWVPMASATGGDHPPTLTLTHISFP